MSITDKLRNEARAIQTFTCMTEQANRLLDIADRIDAEHERVCYDYQREFEDWKFVHDNDFVELPKDANGEVIHIGDVMENLRDDLEPPLHRRFRVYGIRYRDHEQVCALTEEGYPSVLYRANECRHYHAQTVEDVLREFGDWYAHTKGGCDEDGIIAEYVAKLRLADDVKEQ